MRISSRASWLLSASLAYVAADDTAGETISFNSDCFNGFTLGDSGMTTTIIGYNDLKSHDCINITDLAWDFGWTSTDKNIQILSIILGNEKDQTQIARAYGGSVSDSQGNSFAADYESSGSLTLNHTLIDFLYTSYKDTPLFFQVEWNRTGSSRKRDDSHGFSYSPSWALSDNEQDAQNLLTKYPYLSPSTPSSPAYTQGPDPTVPYGHTEPSTTATPAGTADSSTSTAASASSVSKHHSGGLGVGPIVGIALGGLVFLVAVSSLLGCVCMKRRRRMNRGIDTDPTTSRNVPTMQDLMAEKERRAITDNTLDTPYSEAGGSQHALPHRPMSRGLGMSGLNNGSAVDVAGTGARASLDSGSHYSRHSAAYSSLPAIGTAVTTGRGTGDDSPTYTQAPRLSASESESESLHDEHERSSMLAGRSGGGEGTGLPAPHTHQDRAFSPYRDGVGIGVGSAARLSVGIKLDLEAEVHMTARARGAEENSTGWSQVNLAAAAAAAAAAVPDDDTIPPPPGSIHDNASVGGGAGSRAATPTRFVRSTTPGGISERYAHLVEEGMTEDEIRRLEEEERVLDEAIEQARGDSRATPDR